MSKSMSYKPYLLIIEDTACSNEDIDHHEMIFYDRKGSDLDV
jgi:hypothetical protein